MPSDSLSVVPSFGPPSSVPSSNLVADFLAKTATNPKRIGVVGDSMIDEYYQVSVDRISPEFPIPVMLAGSMNPVATCLGGAANVWRQLMEMTDQPRLVSFVDRLIENIIRLYDRKDDSGHYLCEFLRCPMVPVKKRFYQGKFPLCRIDIEAKDYRFLPESIQERRDQLFANYKEHRKDDLLILADYAKGIFTGKDSRKRWTTLAPTIVDPKDGPLDGWYGSTIFKPNAHEAQALSGQSDWKRQAQHFAYNVSEHVVITRGSQGVCGWDNRTKRNFEYVPPTRGDSHSVQSVIGAGDCFVAFLALAYLQDFTIAECAQIAYQAGAAYTLNLYNQPIGPHDLMRYVDPIRAKYLHPSPVGGNLIFANGCFDLLHAGHIALLQWAKAQGGRLVVALNSDESVRRLKGDSRPILPLAERQAAVAALECVDHVFSFDEDTPLRLIQDLKPYSMVKGSDWQGQEIAGREFVFDVLFFPLVPGLSTTSTIDRIRDSLRNV